MERDNSTTISSEINIYTDSNRHRRAQRRRRQQQFNTKLQSLEKEQQMICKDIIAMLKEQLNDEKKLETYHLKLEELERRHIDQRRQIQRLEEEVRKLRALPTILDQTMNYFRQQLAQFQR